MGWTHSWKRPIELPTKEFQAAVSDVRQALEAIGLELAGFEGLGDPVLNDDHIVFNGPQGQHCEPFEISRVEFDRRGRSSVSGFCKTERLPYDLAVQASLIILKHHLAELITVTSDAGDDDWAEARTALQEAIGYGLAFRLDG